MSNNISRRTVMTAVTAGATGTALAGCGGSGGEQATAPPENSEDLSGSITMWIYPLAPDATEEWYQSHIDSFMEKYPNVGVEVVLQPWESREEQLTTSITGGNAPDVCYFTPDFLPRFADQDLLMGLDELRDNWDTFLPSAREALTWNDTLYSAPILVQASPTFANSRILEELGMEGPTTWDEMRVLGQAAHEAGYYLTHYLGTESLNQTFYQYLWQAGGAVLSEDQSEAAFNSSEGLDALEFIKEMVDNGWLPTESFSQNLPFEQTELAQGNVAYSIGTNLPQVQSTLEDDIEILPPMEHREQVAIGGFGALSIFNTTESPEAAAAWVHHLTEPDFITAMGSEFAFYSPRSDVTGLHEEAPQVAEFEQYLEHVHPEVIHPQSREIMDSLTPSVQEVLLEGKDPQAALDAMETSVNELLDRG